jgi:hypothetical protein
MSTDKLQLEDISEALSEGRPLRSAERYRIIVLDENLQEQKVMIDDPVPCGRQILDAVGYVPADNHVLLMIRTAGMLEEVNLEETIDIYQQGVEQFIVFKSDRIFYFSCNGRRLPWGAQLIKEETLRVVCKIPADQDIWLESKLSVDRPLCKGEDIDLAAPGLEKLYSQPKSWKLNVQGVLITSSQPTIVASTALQKAGFNPDKGWILILKIKDQPKKNIGLNDVIDLTNPGIEKLRLTPAEINNGEGVIASKMQFSLLEKDHNYLNGLGLNWETVVDGSRRWLIIHNYILPAGYNQNTVRIASEIPPAYPDAALDMFYVYPPLLLSGGGVIAQTQISIHIYGDTFQRWSRHLNGATKWNPLVDCIASHLAVVEESLLREVGQ